MGNFEKYGKIHVFLPIFLKFMVKVHTRIPDFYKMPIEYMYFTRFF